VVGRLAVKTLCDSWLEHIYQKKIRFSEGGAKRLAADFAFFRQWVDSSPHLTDEAKRWAGGQWTEHICHFWQFLWFGNSICVEGQSQVPSSSRLDSAVRGCGEAASGDLSTH
jgi:hypothetical protein